jgi:hypothetical protein
MSYTTQGSQLSSSSSSSYMALQPISGLGLLFMRFRKIALFGELSLEEAIDLSGDRQILD